MNTTMNIYTDAQLQLALSKMLPETLHVTTKNVVEWLPNHGRVNETEWLHVCWLIEEELSDKEIDLYLFVLDSVVDLGPFPSRISAFRYHSSWQQRVIALAKVRGMEII